MGKNVAEVIEQQEVETQTTSKPNIKKSRNGALFGIIIILIIICVAGAGYFFLQQLRDKQKDLGGELSKDSQLMMELTKQISGYQAQLVEIQGQLTRLSSNVDNKDENFEHRLNDVTKVQNDRIENVSEHINESIQRIQRQLGQTRGDWLVSDAEYLLAVASRRLHLMGDVQTTIAALKAADQRLRESGDTATFKVRAQITKDLAAIKKIEVADIVGVYATLDMLEGNVENLNLLLPYSGKKPTKEAVTKDDSLLGNLSQILAIKRLDQSVSAILTIEQKQFIQTQLQTKLTLIKSALMQHNDSLYQAALNDSLRWLALNFNKDKQYADFESDLKTLQKVRIRSDFPDISQALKMLRNIAKLRLETDKALQTTIPSNP